MSHRRSSTIGAALLGAVAVLVLAMAPQASAQFPPGQGPDDDYSEVVTTTTTSTTAPSTTTTTTAPSTTTTTSTTIPVVSPSSAVQQPAVAGVPLARTGTSVATSVGIALLLVASGLLLIRTQRR